ncbi:hypothetical protein ZWY2020_016162 [Hordeum vulgare]|nr:hypothetical protein ZWY2020_016162 [Hordeum vulgare]
MADEVAAVSAPSRQRLILYCTIASEDDGVIKVKIGHATQLAVLGYLDTATHQLEIGNTIIKAGRDKCLPEYSGSNFQASSLATTPTTSMTRAKSSPATSSSPHSGRGSVDQMREKSHVKKLVFDQFSGGTNQVEFLSLVLGRAVLLQKVIVLLAGQESISVREAMSKLQPLASKRMWASKVSGKPSLEVGVLAAGHVWRYDEASDLSMSDPFIC